MPSSRAYRVWKNMKRRCDSPSCPEFKYYGGRGIGCSPEWKCFENFLLDLGEPPTNLTLERINNNLGYSKENCRWATRSEQTLNRSYTKLVTWRGETKCVSHWERDLGFTHGVLRLRIKSGLSIEDAFTLPIAVGGRYQKYT